MLGLLALVLIALMIMLAIDLPWLIKEKMWRELAAYIVLVVLWLGLTIPQVLGITLPSPSSCIAEVFKPLSDLLKPTE